MKPNNLKTIIDLDTDLNYSLEGMSTGYTITNIQTRFKYEECDNLETLELPNITSLFIAAFNDLTLLSTLKLSNKLESINGSITNGALVSITYDGTMDEWNNITKTNWNTNNQIKTIICNDGTITL